MKKRMEALVLAAMLALGIFFTNGESSWTGKDTVTGEDTVTGNEIQALNVLDDNYRTYYEVFLYSFCDSDGDGIGDIQGLIQKLDYINDGDDSTDTDLGCNGIWLMPIMPSTTYHKYDVTDYCDIDEQYGTMVDFEELIEECHSRGIRVIIDFVMNHTSSQHPWFQEACSYLESLPEDAEPSVEECPYIDYYHFTREQTSSVYYQVGDTPWYYEAEFWSEMPDLNLESEDVRAEFDTITSFWLDEGVDGFRMDATSQYATGNTTENVAVLSWFTDMVKAKKEDAYIVCECWEGMNTYAQYYASGVDSMFDFDFGDSTGIIASTLNGMSGYTASSYGKAVAKLSDLFGSYNENYIDAPFYTNHDMGRSAGYYSGDYSEEKTKMAGAMNLLMSGSAFLYYGEELGMKGSGADENKRAPMYWSDDATEAGMCVGPENMGSIKMKFGSLKNQQEDALSVYHYYKQVIRLRNCYPEIARGTVTFREDLSDDSVCVLEKEYEGSTILLAFNLSPEEQNLNIEETNWSFGGELLTAEEESSYEEGSLVMPGYSVVLLTEE